MKIIKKNAEVDAMHVVIAAALLLMVFTVTVIIYSQFFGSEVNIAKCHIANLKEDCDGDGIANAVDKCPCPGGENNEDGCEKQKGQVLSDCFDEKECKCK